MKYTSEIRIDRPREQVVALYSDHSELAAWLPGFVRIEPLVKNYGVAGSTATLYCKNQQTISKILATIEVVDLPEKMTIRFECDDLWYRNESVFFNGGDHTIWQLKMTFGFKGLLRWTAKAHLPFFKSATVEKMARFKTYAQEKISQDASPVVKKVSGFAVNGSDKRDR